MGTAFRFTFNVAGQQQLDRTLQIAVDRCDDLSPAFETIHSGAAWMHAKKVTRFTPFLKMERDQFRAEGARGPFGRWADLRPKYKAIKDVLAPGAPILVLTGRGRASLMNAGHSEHIKAITKRQAAFGTSAPHMIFHQTGTEKMKMRRPIDLTEKDRRDWVRVAHRFIVDSFDQAERARGGAMRDV